MADRRLDRLRDTAARLERLPASPERDRVLGEVRARIVDLDTGFTPQPMRPAEEDPIDAPAPPARRTLRKPERAAVADAAPAAPPEPEPPAPDAEDTLESIGDRLSLEDASQPTDPDDPDDDRAWRRGLRG
jgi:hypothetical protein